MDRYKNKPEETVQRCAGQLYRTGDSARLDKDGYVHFVGRVDDVIISSGYRIGPFEVESCILEHAEVAESTAVADTFKPEIQQLVRGRLSQSEYPREIEFVSDLPKTRSGKIIRKELRQRACEEFERQSNGSDQPPAHLAEPATQPEYILEVLSHGERREAEAE